MPPTIKSVTERRTFEINSTTGEATREFLVQFIAADEIAFEYEEKAFEARNATDPITALAIPQEGTVLDPTRWGTISVDNIEAEQLDEQNNLWLVTVTYVGSTTEGTQKGVNPEDEPWTFNWTKAARQVILRSDFSSPRRAILNSAGLQFTEQILVDEPIRRLVISRKDILSDFDPVDTLNFINKVNDASVDIENETFAAGTVRIDTWDGVTDQKEVIILGVSTIKDFYQVTIEALINPKGWSGFILDTGKKERIVQWNPRTELPANTRIDYVRDENKIIDPGPHLLNGFGQRLINADSSINTPINTDSIVIDTALSTNRGVYMKYKLHEEATLNPTMRLDQQP